MHTLTQRPRRTARHFLAPAAFALLALGACGDDGPSAPSVFDPVALQGDLGFAAEAMTAPATESFAAIGFMIDYALGGFGGGGLVVEAPALLLEGALKPKAELKQRLRTQASLKMASAIPAELLGETFEYDPETGEYAPGNRTGAPNNGVRFVLYAIDPLQGTPVVPLVEVGRADLTRTGSSTSAVARVQVVSGAAVTVLDYQASVEGSATSPRIEVEGFARNGDDRLDFELATSFSLASDEITINWRTEMPTRGLTTRLEQRFVDGSNPRFTIDAAVISENGRVDLDGTVTENSGGTLTVKVNNETFARMILETAESEEPVIENAQGEPLTEEETETLHQIFEWFAGAFFTYISLLAPMGTLLDTAF